MSNRDAIFLRLRLGVRLFRAHSCEEAQERQKYINTAARTQCRELGFERIWPVNRLKWAKSL